MPELIGTPIGMLVPHIRFNGGVQVSGRLGAGHADTWVLSSMVGGSEVGVVVKETRLHLT